jgi:hypothetical protein
MSSIALHTIIIDPTDPVLNISGGTALMSSTAYSVNSTTASFVFNGGVSIGGTEASSATQGGSLSIKGLGVSGKVFTGNSVTCSGDFNFDVGTRLAIGKTTDASIVFKPNGSSNVLELLGNSVLFKSTQVSSNNTVGSAVFFGGVSIFQTNDSVSSTEGGSLSVYGGMSLAKDLRAAKKIIIDYNGGGIDLKTSSGAVSSINNSVESLIITSTGVNVVSSNIKLGTLVTIGSSILNVNPSVVSTFNNTSVSINGSTGSIVSKGGVACTNIFNTGSYEGTSINASSTVGISTSADGSKIVLFSTSGSASTISTVSSGSLIFDTAVNGSFIWKSGSSNILELNTSGTLLIRDSGENYEIGSLFSSLNFQGKGLSSPSQYSFYTNDGDLGDDNSIRLYALGTPSSTTNTEYLSTMWDSTNSKYKISVGNTGTGIKRNLSIENLEFFTSGNTVISAGSLTVDGGLTVNGSGSFGSNVTVGSSIRIGESLHLKTVDLTVSSGNLIVSGGNLIISNGSPRISLYDTGLPNSGTLSNLTFTKNSIFTESSGGGTLNNLSIYTGLVTNQLYLTTSGNIGINTTNATVTLTVNGDFTCNNGTLSNLSLGTGSLVINNTVDTNSLTSASLYTFGGVGVSKSLYVGNTVSTSVVIANNGSIGTLHAINATLGTLNSSRITTGTLKITSTEESTGTPGSTTGSVVIHGGVSILKNLLVNTSSIFNGSSTFTVDNQNILFNTTNNVKRLSLNRETASHDFQISRYDDTEALIDNPLVITHTSGNISLNYSTIKGITVNTTTDSSGIGTGGSATILGGLAVSKTVYTGNAVITTTTDSTDSSTGALQVKGGAGILGNVFIEKNLTINGDFTVNGTHNLINSTDIEIENNTMTLNGGPLSSRDSGVFIKRYQTINDAGTGDVVTDTEYVSFTLPSQSGMTSTQVKLPATASSSDDYYTNWYIKVSSGFSANQVRLVSGYVGSSRVATISTAWTDQNPTINDIVLLYDSPYVGFVFNEINKRFDLVSAVNDTYGSTITSTGYIQLKTRSIALTDTSLSNNLTSGSIITTGGITITNTADASGNTLGGSLLTMGGASFAKSVYTGDLYVNGSQFTPNTGDIFTSLSFAGSSGVGSPASVTGLSFAGSVTSADIFLSVVVTATVNLYANFNIRLINKGTLWDINSSYLGDETGIAFTITTGGQVQYTSPVYAGFTDMTVKFRALVN